MSWEHEIRRVANDITSVLHEHMAGDIALIVLSYDDLQLHVAAGLDAIVRPKAIALGIRVPVDPLVFVAREGCSAQVVSMLLGDQIVTQYYDPRPIWRPDPSIRGVMGLVANNTYQDAILTDCNTHQVSFKPRSVNKLKTLEFENTLHSCGLRYDYHDRRLVPWGGPGYPSHYPQLVRVDIPFGTIDIRMQPDD